MSASVVDESTLPAVEARRAVAADGATAEVLLQRPAGPVREVLYWLPALGVSARQYLPLAQALAMHGVAMAIHEWRGIGSSNHRAGRHDDWGYRELLRQDLPAGVSAVQAVLPGTRYWFGGHSLGGQIATLHAALHPAQAAGLVMVASGAPYWRGFRHARLVWLSLVLAPWLARMMGYLPGRRIGFGGNEARSLIADWARSGRTGRYAAAGIEEGLEQRLAALALPVLALRLSDDWLAPRASLAWLLGKLPRSHATQEVLTPGDLDGRPADHFGWMKAPVPVAERIAHWLGASS